MSRSRRGFLRGLFGQVTAATPDEGDAARPAAPAEAKPLAPRQHSRQPGPEMGGLLRPASQAVRCFGDASREDTDRHD